MLWSSLRKPALLPVWALLVLVLLAVLLSSLLPARPAVAQDSSASQVVKGVSTPVPAGVPEPPRGWGNSPNTSARLAGIDSTGWSKVENSFGEVRWIVVIPTSPNYVFASIDGVGLFRSVDAGQTWTPMSTTGLTDKSIQAFAVCPSGKIYAGTWGGGIFRHDPQSQQWTQLNNGLTQLYVSAVSCDAQNIVLAGTYDQGVFRSTDDGLTWTPANNGIRASSKDLKTLTLFSVPGIIGLGTANGAYVSYDGGKTWKPAGLDGHGVYDFAYDRAGSNEIWAGTNTGGVFATRDGGVTWSSIGGPSSIYTVSQGWDLSLYAGTRDTGVYRYEGGQWVLDGLGEAGRKVYLLRWAAYNRLLAGASDGLWAAVTDPRTPTPTATDTPEPTETPTPTSTPAPPSVVLALRSEPDGPVNGGAEVSYYIDYQVVGENIVSSVVITNAVPANVDLAPGSIDPPGQTSSENHVISWSLGALPPGSASTLSYRVVAPLTSAEPITVINRGAYAYWSFSGGNYWSRSNVVINGQVRRIYLPVIQRN